MQKPKLNSTQSKEYKAFKILQLWQPTTALLPPKELANPESKLFPLFVYFYDKTKKEYEHFPRRKNGQDPFIHPLNVVWQLQRAQVHDEITWCIALLHDLVEEKVDVYRIKNKISLSSKSGIKILDDYELSVFQELKRMFTLFCQETGIEKNYLKTIFAALKLLTRHKRDFYYRSISNIFNCPNQKLKERVIQVKLADRLHNVLSIETFNEEARTYECYKNLFILNNTKKFLLETYGEGVFSNQVFTPTEILFNKCAKATYDAFLYICNSSRQHDILKVVSMLQLAFKKFAFMYGGIWKVTEMNKKEKHLMRIYQGILRKYDTRLRHEFDRYDRMKLEELSYCRNFFVDYHFSERQLNAIMDYKDAYALKEVIGYLLYQSDYVTTRFLYSKMFRKA